MVKNFLLRRRFTVKQKILSVNSAGKICAVTNEVFVKKKIYYETKNSISKLIGV